MESEHKLIGSLSRGKHEMHELAVCAFTALEHVELGDVGDSLQARVFGRSPQELLDVELVDSVWEWRFKPMIELLLRHVIEAAASEAMSSTARQTEIMWAVQMAGF